MTDGSTTTLQRLQSRGAMVSALIAAATLTACAHASTQAALRAGETFQDCANCPEMVVAPAGAFIMGSPDDEKERWAGEGPQRRISFARNFAIGRTEVTRAQYAAFVRATGRSPADECYTNRNGDDTWELDATATWMDPGFAQGDDHPVVCVTWEDARAYVDWLNSTTSGGYRLPTESEWEYAARAGGRSGAYPWGAEASHDSANYGGEHCSPCHGAVIGRDRWMYTSPVASFPANGFGLFDMHGNAWEWVQDCFERKLNSLPVDSSAREPQPCADRMFRGGSWDVSAQYLRSAQRMGDHEAGNYSGLRVAKTLQQQD